MPTIQEFRLPDAGEGLTEAEIVQWRVAPGDVVRINETLVEIETAKSLVELPSPWDGTVVELLVEEGTTVDVGTPIVRIETEGGTTGDDVSGAGPAAAALETAAEVDPTGEAAPDGGGAVLVGYGTGGAAAGGGRRRRRTATGEAPSAPPAAPAPATPAPVAAPASTAPSVRVLAKPPVRKLAKDLGVDLLSVPGTGPGGIVTREDVQAFASEAAHPETLASYPGDDDPWLSQGSVSPDARRTRVPVKSVRRRTAEAMVASAFTAPHVTEFVTVDVTKTMKLVAALREDREFADVRVTPLLVTAKALLLALRRHPEINASWDDAAQEIVYKHYVNLGIAAATPRGLVVPNIKDAHRLGLHDLAVAIADLTTTARSGRTTPTDMSDGTITITNVGVFGIDTGTPILNPGEAGILAFGAIRQQPWVHKGKIKKRWITQLALSFDHRLVDGELGSRVLADVAAVLEEPSRGLVWG